MVSYIMKCEVYTCYIIATYIFGLPVLAQIYQLSLTVCTNQIELLNFVYQNIHEIGIIMIQIS